MRQVLLHQYQVESLKYLESNQIGIAEVYDIDERFISEYIFIFVNGIVYKIRLRLKRTMLLEKVFKMHFCII